MTTFLLLALLQTGGISNAVQAPGPAAGEPPAAAREITGWFHDTTLGTAYAFDVRLESSLAFGDARGLAFSLSATWVLEVAAHGARGTLFEARLEKPLLEFENAEHRPVTPESFARIRRDLARTHFLEISTRGDVLHASLPRDLATFAQSLIKGLAGLGQLVSPPAPGARWLRRESDASGIYEAEYRRIDPSTIVKTKRAYAAPASEPAAFSDGARVEIIAHRAEFEIASGRPRRVDVLDHLRLTTPQLLPFETVSRLELRLAQTSRSSGRPMLQALGRDFHTGPLHGRSSAEALRHDLDLVKIGGRKLGDVLRTFAEYGGESRQHRKALNAAYIALVSLLRRDPEALASSAEIVRSRGPHHSELISALGQAATPETQSVLVALLRGSEIGDPVRLQLLQALSDEGSPTPEAVAALISYLDDPELRAQAHYGLGASVSYLRDQEPERAREILDAILERLSSPASEAAAVLALRAVGNSGDPRALAAIAPYLEDERVWLRAEAVESLRRMPPLPRVYEILSERARRDPSEKVRHAVLRVISDRDLTPERRRLLEELAGSDGSQDVRREARRLLEFKGS